MWENRAFSRFARIRCELRDERFGGEALGVSFAGTLRPDQEDAVAALLRHDIGILCAPTAFGKTITAAAVIARRAVNTLVLVHRTELLRQWQERLQAFLGVGREVVGTIGGGKSRPTGSIDVAVMQPLVRQGEVNEIVENYGQIVVDECHHLSAFSFEAILKRARARHVLGLTATPMRRDGRQPIIFMQCGPIRHSAARPAGAPQMLEVVPATWTPASMSRLMLRSRTCSDTLLVTRVAAPSSQTRLRKLSRKGTRSSF